MAALEKKFDVTPADIDKLMNVFSKLNPRDIWSRVNREDFTVRRFATGVMNDISCCELTAPARKRLCSKTNDLPAIVVKFVHKNFSLSKPDWIACNVLLSEHKITPKLCYIDDHCAINEYIDGRTYNQQDDLEPETVKQLARLLARVHSLNVPISMEGYKQYKLMENWIDNNFDPDEPSPELEKVLNREYLKYFENEPKEIREKCYTAFAEIDFREIMAYTKKLRKLANSPIVYSHSDFNRTNRLVKEFERSNGSTGKEIYLIDFDMATLNHRGYDLGRYFTNYRHLEDMFGGEDFPADDEMALFLEEYRHECGRLQGEQYLQLESSSLDQLIKEAKVFALGAYGDYLFCLMMYTNDPNGKRKDFFLQSSLNRYNSYLKQKQRFVQDGTVQSVLDQCNALKHPTT